MGQWGEELTAAERFNLFRRIFVLKRLKLVSPSLNSLRSKRPYGAAKKRMLLEKKSYPN